MALPKQIKSARISGASAVSAWPTTEAGLEADVADIFGLPLDTDIKRAQRKQVEYAEIADGATVTNSTTLTVHGKNYTIPGGTLQVGDLIRVFAAFNVLSFSGGGFLNSGVRIGGPAGYWGYTQINASPTYFWNELVGTVRAIGASGLIYCRTRHNYLPGSTGMFTGGANGSNLVIDTTGGILIESASQWTVAAAGNQVQQELQIAEIIPAAATA